MSSIGNIELKIRLTGGTHEGESIHTETGEVLVIAGGWVEALDKQGLRVGMLTYREVYEACKRGLNEKS